MQPDRPIISVVDDDESVRVAIGNLLRSVGFDASVFSSGAEFMASAALATTDCLIVDLRMADMSGLDLQQQLAVAGMRIPIVFISAHGDADAKARALKGGAVDFLSKPFSESSLLSSVRLALGSKDRGPG